MTPRQQQAHDLLAKGMKQKDIAIKMGVSASCVCQLLHPDKHKYKEYRKEYRNKIKLALAEYRKNHPTV